MAARTSWLGSIIQGILSRIGTLETQVGQTPDPDDYTDKDDVRSITGYSDADRVLCLENQYIYIFDDASAVADDDDIVLCPDDITHPAPGRWVRDTRLALYEHNHDPIYQKLITTPTQNRFTAVNASGQLVETAYHANSWAPYTHEHAGYASTTSVEALDAALDALSDIVNNKMDKLAPTAGQVDEILTVDANGNAQMSGTKIADLERKWATITIPADDNGYDHDTTLTTEPVDIQIKNTAGYLLGYPSEVDIQVFSSEATSSWHIKIINYKGETLTNAKLSYK
jgi:hypothetical protein